MTKTFIARVIVFFVGIIACLVDRKWMCYEASGDVMMVEFEVYDGVVAQSEWGGWGGF